MDDIESKTYSIVEAGRVLGVGRAAAYAAAKRGDIPTIQVGGRKMVPKAAIERMLAIDSPETPAAP